MTPCEYCEKEAITKRMVYDADASCSIEVNVCQACADYIDEWEGK